VFFQRTQAGWRKSCRILTFCTYVTARCTHIAPSRCTLTLSTRYTHVAYVAHVHSSYTRCTHVMLRTLHLRNVAQVHSWCAGAVMLYTCTLCCTAALVLHRCIHVAYVYSCSTGAIMLHRCIHVAQVYSCCTGATILH